MIFSGVNYVAILAAGIASFVFGGIWYGVLAKQWMAAAGMRDSEVAENPKIGGVQWQLPVTFVVLLVMAFMLAGVIGHLGSGQVGVWNGIVCGFFVWLGFVITTMYVNHAYQRRPLALTVIDGVHWLGVLLIQGAIIGIFGV